MIYAEFGQVHGWSLPGAENPLFIGFRIIARYTRISMQTFGVSIFELPKHQSMDDKRAIPFRHRLLSPRSLAEDSS